MASLDDRSTSPSFGCTRWNISWARRCIRPLFVLGTGQGIIAHGTMKPGGDFVADEVLAKHDENYLPPEVADSLKQVHGEGG